MKLESIGHLMQSSEYKTWKEHNKHAYLVHAVVIEDEANKDTWNIGFFDEKADKITTFIVRNSHVEGMPETESAFKEEGKKISELEIDKVNVDFDKAQKIADEIQNKNYARSKPFKKVFILQNLDKFGNIWNITFITIDFKTINIKINAEDGEVVEHKIVNIIQSMQKGERS